MYDIFFISAKPEIDPQYKKLKLRFPILKTATDFETAKDRTLTEFFWVIWDDILIDDSFEFDYVPNEWSKEYIHTFLNNNSHDGVILVPRDAVITKKEIAYRFFIKEKGWDIVASRPKPYDIFFVDNYDEYLHAFENSTTELFWATSRNIQIDADFDFNFYFTYDNINDRYENHAFIHRVDCDDYYNGLFLLSKHKKLTKNEIDIRFPNNRREVGIVASGPKQYDIFVVDTYDEYLHAFENSTTEMFWASSRNIKIIDEFDFSTYFTYDNTYDRYENHAFIHHVDGKNLYNGLFLLSKHKKLTKKEIDFRFPVNRKEVNIVASGPKQYDIFVVDTYDEYLHAFENSTTEMFWATSRNIKIADDFDFSTYFTYDNTYDRCENHAFIHRVNGQDSYNGLFLLSKHKKLTKKEIDFRFPVNRKEVNKVASGPTQYDIFVVDTYDEYLHAFENSTTEMFWASSRNIQIDANFDFNFYFTYDNTHDRYENHAFIHRVDGQDLYNGLFLLSKHKKLTKKEIDFRFPINRKEWNMVASGPKPYDIFVVDTYDEYVHAFENSTTEMFWATSNNIKINSEFNFSTYFTYDNVHDRYENHAFIHRVNGQDLYNGLFLLSKHKKLTKKEIDFRFPVNRKEVQVVASGPVDYEKFLVNTYDDYLTAFKNSKTEMFWVIPNYVTLNPTADFSMYFTYDQIFERSINHTFLNGKYYDGVILCSKLSQFSKREFDYKFIANKVETPVVMSSPKPYDIVFISYKEPTADDNYKLLMEQFPRANRIHGITGIHNAHIAAAKLAKTDMVWIVDGDAVIVDNFNFNYQVPMWDREVVHVWRSMNPVNDLVYGYGGVKLLPTTLTINMDTTKPDMTTSITNKFKAVTDISNITAFNTDPFNTWRSAFRECCKLSSKIIDRQKDDETNLRLHAWCTLGEDRMYGKYAIAGAKSGAAYGTRNKDNIESLKKINDFDWLKEQFDATNI